MLSVVIYDDRLQLPRKSGFAAVREGYSVKLKAFSFMRTHVSRQMLLSSSLDSSTAQCSRPGSASKPTRSPDCPIQFGRSGLSPRHPLIAMLLRYGVAIFPSAARRPISAEGRT